MSSFDAAALLARRAARQPQVPILRAGRRDLLDHLENDPKVAEQLHAYRNAVYKALRFHVAQVSKLQRGVVRVRWVRDPATGQLKEERQDQPFHPVSVMFAKGARGNPNPWQTSGNFLGQMVLDLGLAGNSYSLKVRDTMRGPPVWLVRLRPDWVRVVPDERAGIRAYRYRPGGVENPVTYAPSEIVHVKHPSPLDERVGWSPLRAMAYGADLGQEIRRYQFQFFEQGARIDGVVSGVNNPEQIDELYDLWIQQHHQGPETAFLPLVLPSGLSFTATQMTAKDFEFAALADFSEDDVFEAYGVPRALVGHVKDVNRANLQGLMTIAAENGIRPLTGVIEEHLEADLLAVDWPGTGASDYLEFDFEDPTPGDPEELRERDAVDLKSGKRVINELRARDGEPPVEWGDRPWLPITVTQPGGDEDEGEDEDPDDEGEDDGRSAALWVPPPAPRWSRAVRQHELAALVEEALAQALGHRADAALIERLRPGLVATLLGGAAHAAELLALAEATVLAGSAVVQRYLEEHVPRLVRVNDWTRRRVRTLTARAVADGDPLSTLERRLRREFRALRVGRRGLTVARTEAGIAWHMGSYEQLREGAAGGNLWITSRDARVRDSHLIDGQCRLVGVPFDTAAGNQLLHPHDPNGPAAEVVNCRCVNAPVPSCDEGRLLEDAGLRTVYWRAIIAQLTSRERVVRRLLAREADAQGRAFFAAFGAAA